MRFLTIFAWIIFPALLMVVFLSPRDTWRDVKFAFGGRLLRRGLRFRVPRLPKLPRIRFSLLTTICVTAFIATQFAIANWVTHTFPNSWWVSIAFSSTCFLYWLFGVYLSSCTAPQRKQRKTYQAVRPDPNKPLPKIDARGVPRHRSHDSSITSFQIDVAEPDN